MMHYPFDFPQNDIFRFVQIILTFYVKSMLEFKYSILLVKGELQKHETDILHFYRWIRASAANIA